MRWKCGAGERCQLLFCISILAACHSFVYKNRIKKKWKIAGHFSVQIFYNFTERRRKSQNFNHFAYLSMSPAGRLFAFALNVLCVAEQKRKKMELPRLASLRHGNNNLFFSWETKSSNFVRNLTRKFEMNISVKMLHLLANFYSVLREFFIL